MNPFSLAVGKKAAVALGVLGIAAAGVATNLSGAAASTSYYLSPSGPTAYGSGFVGIDYAGNNLVVHVDLSGTRGSTLYRLSVCAAGPSQCSSDPNNDLIMTTTDGGIHGAYQVPAPARADVVTLVDQRDSGDSFQAVINAANVAPTANGYTQPAVAGYPTIPYVTPGYPFFANPFYRYPWIVGPGGVVTTGNMLFVPFGTTVQPGVVCPVGFHGPLVVTVGGYGYPFFTLYGWPFNGLPAGAATVTVNC
jgi:hypothetical protein